MGLNSNNNFDSSGILSAGINAASNLSATYAGIHSAEKISQLDRDFAMYQQLINYNYNTQERLAAQQYTLDMWNMANEYNSPAAQLERARLAGINPNAVIAGMHGGVAAHPVSSSGQTGSISSYNSGLAGSVIGAYQNMGRAIGDAGMLAADVRKTNAEANNIDANTDRTNRLTPLEEKRFKAETQKFFREIKNIDFNEKEQAALNEWTKALDKAKISEINENLNKIRNEALLLSEKIITEQKTQGLISEQTSNIHQKTENDKVQHKILEEIFEQEQIKAQVSQATGIPVDAPAWYAMFALWKSGDISRYLDIGKVALYSGNQNVQGWNNPILHESAGMALAEGAGKFIKATMDRNRPSEVDYGRIVNSYSKNGKMHYVIEYEDGRRVVKTNFDLKKEFFSSKFNR